NTDSVGSSEMAWGGGNVPTLTNSLVRFGGLLTPTGLTPDANGNLIGSLGDPIEPLLDVIADNRGPTPTHALLPGSPAIDRGSNPVGLVADQRGFPFARASGAMPDMGAFEVQPPPVMVVTTPDDELDATLDLNDLSLREALALADANPGIDTLTFASGLGGVPVRLTLGQLEVRDSVVIRGLGAADTIIDALGGSRL